MGATTILRDAQEMLTKRKLESNISFKLLDIGGDLRSKVSQISESFTCNYCSLNNNNQKGIVKFDLNIDSLYEFLINRDFDTIVFLNVLEHLENPVFVINELFKGALKTKANKILISTSFLFKYHPSPQDFYRFSSQWYINQFERHNISRDYDIEIIGIGGGFLKYILTLDLWNHRNKEIL